MTPPTWLLAIAITWLILAFGSAAFLLSEVLGPRRPEMPVMRWVWPVTALYMGPFAIWSYRSMAKLQMMQQPVAAGGRGQQMANGRTMASQGASQQPFWKVTYKGVTHCGAGCTLGDIAGEWIIFGLAATIAGLALWPEYIADYILAFTLGIIFQYFAIAPMRHLGLKDGIIAALKADSLALTAFEVGLFAWMALSSFVFFHHHLHPDNPVYWFMMQIGMLAGFATSYPMNWWLIRKGLKEKM